MLPTSRPGGVLCDLRRPRLDGLGPVARARTQGSDAAFVLMTANSPEVLTAQAAPLSGIRVLRKPLDLDAALSLLEGDLVRRERAR